MGFLFLLITTTLSIAGCAAFFSVYGLANIFTSAFVAVVIMGSVLEAGKLVAASFLYRYWNTIGFLLKTYLITAVFVLMLITSLGIYGYLSAAYQSDTVPLKEMEQTITLLEQEKQELTFREKEINADIGRIGSNYVTARERLMAKYAPEKDEIVERRTAITAEILALSKLKVNQEAHTGPIIYIAEQMGQSVDDAISIMILLIIFVFDPLAVMLTIGANMAVARRAADKNESQPDPVIKEVIVDREVVKEVPVEIVKETFRDVPVEVIKEVPVEVIKEVRVEMSNTEELNMLRRELEAMQMDKHILTSKLVDSLRTPHDIVEPEVVEPGVVEPEVVEPEVVEPEVVEPEMASQFDSNDKGTAYQRAVGAAKHKQQDERGASQVGTSGTVYSPRPLGR